MQEAEMIARSEGAMPWRKRHRELTEAHEQLQASHGELLSAARRVLGVTAQGGELSFELADACAALRRAVPR